VPRSSNSALTLPRTAVWIDSDTVMPPGAASASSRAAMFTPSP
jgi:hypothetical protein